jgi:hypothetical protein
MASFTALHTSVVTYVGSSMATVPAVAALSTATAVLVVSAAAMVASEAAMTVVATMFWLYSCCGYCGFLDIFQTTAVFRLISLWFPQTIYDMIPTLALYCLDAMTFSITTLIKMSLSILVSINITHYKH